MFIPQRAKAVRLPRGYYGVGVLEGRHVHQRIIVGRVECGLQGAYQNPDVIAEDMYRIARVHYN